MNDFPGLIKKRRKEIKESQLVFGERFGVTAQTVSYWESGKREAPYKVLYFIINDYEERTINK